MGDRRVTSLPIKFENNDYHRSSTYSRSMD